MSEIDGRKPEIAVIATDYAEKSKNSSKNKPQRISMYRDPNKDVGILLDDNHNKTRVDLRKSLRTARNSNESDVASPKSTHQTPPRERPARPSFEGKLTNTPCDGVRSARSSFESDSRRSEGTRRSTVASAFVNSIHGCCSNDECHLREYVDAVVNGDLEHVQRGIEVCTIDPNYCSTDGFNALFAARYESHLDYCYLNILSSDSFHPAIHQLGRTFACSQLFIEQGFQCECGRSLHKVLSYTCSSHGWLRGGVKSLVRCRLDTPTILFISTHVSNFLH